MTAYLSPHLDADSARMEARKFRVALSRVSASTEIARGTGNYGIRARDYAARRNAVIPVSAGGAGRAHAGGPSCAAHPRTGKAPAPAACVQGGSTRPARLDADSGAHRQEAAQIAQEVASALWTAFAAAGRRNSVPPVTGASRIPAAIPAGSARAISAPLNPSRNAEGNSRAMNDNSGGIPAAPTAIPCGTRQGDPAPTPVGRPGSTRPDSRTGPTPDPRPDSPAGPDPDCGPGTRPADDGYYRVTVTSFGYLHGAAPAADVTVDVREHLRDPHVDPALRHLDALDVRVRNAVLSTPGAAKVISSLAGLSLALTSGPDDTEVSLAVGCAGGRHRSAVIAEEVARMLTSAGIRARAVHRDMHLPVVSRRAPGGDA